VLPHNIETADYCDVTSPYIVPTVGISRWLRSVDWQDDDVTMTSQGRGVPAVQRVIQAYARKQKDGQWRWRWGWWTDGRTDSRSANGRGICQSKWRHTQQLKPATPISRCIFLHAAVTAWHNSTSLFAVSDVDARAYIRLIMAALRILRTFDYRCGFCMAAR